MNAPVPKNLVAASEGKNGLEGRSGRMPIVFFIASRDLWNEKLIAACLVLSVVAVLTPILLLTSVKVGFIDRLRQDFIQDPSYREIRPAAADLRPEKFFDEVRGWPHVLYAMPSVMLTPREVDYAVETGGKPVRAKARLLPSDRSDPLYGKLVGTAPSGDSVVVTQDVAKAASVAIGSKLELSASRIEGDKRKWVSVPVTVSGILPDGTLPIPTILGPPALDSQIESYRAGIAVPERGWRGLESDPKQAFEAIVVPVSGDFGETLRSTLSIRVGASTVEETDVAGVGALLGPLPAGAVQTPPEVKTYVVLKKDQPYAARDVEEANQVLHNSGYKAFGTNPAAAASVLGGAETVVGYEPGVLRLAGLPETETIASQGSTYLLNDHVILPRRIESAWKAAGSPARTDLGFRWGKGSETEEITVSALVQGFSDLEYVLADAQFLGMVDRGRHVPLAFDAANFLLVEKAAGYRGFRTVGDTIDSIPGLVTRFQQAGVEVRARSDEIVKLQRLERSLNILVLVVSAVALLGGYSILSSSFFANVQRKRVDYATLRLLGMSKSRIFNIPVAQAGIVAVLGFAVSVALYFAVSGILNRFIAGELGFDGQLSKLYAWHFLFVGAFVVFGCCAAALMASREATNIDPAQALRAA